MSVVHRAIFLPVLLLLSLLVPGASAQAPAHSVQVTILDLPAEHAANESFAAIPFQLQVTVSGTFCLAPTGANQFEIELRAAVANSTGEFTTASVSPGIVQVPGPPLVSPEPVTSTTPVTLTVDAGAFGGGTLDANILVTATYAGGDVGCVGGTASAPAEASAESAIQFAPPGGGGAGGGGQEMPAPPLLLLVAGLALAAFIRRR